MPKRQPCLARARATLLTLLAVGGVAVAAETPSPCAGIRNDMERLACYDRAEARRVAGEATPDAAEVSKEAFGIRDSVAPAAPVAAATAATAAAAAPGAATTRGPVAEPELKSISARVVAIRSTQDRKQILELDNGQVWVQSDWETLRLKVGDAVTISRGALGSFNLKGSTSQIMKVRRAK